MLTLLVTLLGLLGLWAWLTAFGWDREWPQLEPPYRRQEWVVATPQPVEPAPIDVTELPAFVTGAVDAAAGRSYTMYGAIGHDLPAAMWPDWVRALRLSAHGFGSFDAALGEPA